MLRSLILAAAVMLSACGAPTSPQAESEAPAEGIAISEAWAPPTPGGVDVSAGYLIMTNRGDSADRLIAASTPRAERIELHRMSMENGVMGMEAVEAVELPPGGEAAFAPGGMHLMFIGLPTPFVAGESVPVQLTFEHAGVVDVELPVRAGGAGGHAPH